MVCNYDRFFSKNVTQNQWQHYVSKYAKTGYKPIFITTGPGRLAILFFKILIFKGHNQRAQLN